MIAMLAYNQATFHELSVSGGYGDQFGRQFSDSGVGWFVRNVVGGLVDPRHGLLSWAPFLLVLIPATVAARATSRDWCIGSALGGALYLLVQYRANRFSGGEGHHGYRYPLEAPGGRRPRPGGRVLPLDQGEATGPTPAGGRSGHRLRGSAGRLGHLMLPEPCSLSCTARATASGSHGRACSSSSVAA